MTRYPNGSDLQARTSGIVARAEKFEPVARDAGLLLARLTVGGLFIFHGSAKFLGGIDGFAGYLASLGVPLPTLNAYLAAGTEVFAGLAVTLGVLTRLASVPLVFTMAVAFFVAKGAALSPNGGGGEYALALGLTAAALILTGPGRFTATALLRRGSITPASVRQPSPTPA